MIEDILDELVENGCKGTPDVVQEKIASMACKSAVKGNQSMNHSEMKELLDQLFASGKFYYDELMGGTNPTISAKPNYSDLKEYRDSFRFYGSYNNASVLFVIKIAS